MPCLFSRHNLGHCLSPLGLEGGWIPNGGLDASTQFDSEHTPRHARLHGPSAWIPSPDDPDPQLTVIEYSSLISLQHFGSIVQYCHRHWVFECLSNNGHGEVGGGDVCQSPY